MTKDRLQILTSTSVPEPDAKARARALEMAMASFDAQQTEKKSVRTQETTSGGRLTVILNLIKGWLKMDTRIPVAATLSALLLLPIGILLMQSTSFTPPSQTPLTEQDGRAQNNEALRRPKQDLAATDTVGVADDARQAPVGALQGGAVSAFEAEAAPKLQIKKPTASEQSLSMPAPSPKSVDFDDQLVVSGYNGRSDTFAEFDDAAIQSVATMPVSTFSTDVDTASYTYMRRALVEGRLPSPDAIRVEELINYFHYDYTVPNDPAVPFATDIQVMPSPWDAGKQIIRIGLQGYEASLNTRQPVNLVFLIDSSGSMNEPDKLPLLKSAFHLLINQLGEDDTISIVTYAGSAGTVLEPTKASNQRQILQALDRLDAGGATAGAAGIKAAYDLAHAGQKDGVTSRVILATDGDFNVGTSSPDALKSLIESQRDAGIFLSVLGFGTGNLNDAIMQSLAQNGNGTAHYIDNFREAQRVLVEEIGATLMPIASDVKVQVEFNPAQVAEYRLIGYETRALNREDFNNDRVDAGDVGAGLSVTALYEITPVGSDSVLLDPLRYGNQEPTEVAVAPSGEIGFFKLRYKLPGESDSQLYTQPISDDLVVNSVDAADEDARFALAVAAFGQKLRHNNVSNELSFADIRTLAAGARGTDKAGYRAEFLSLVDLAKSLSKN